MNDHDAAAIVERYRGLISQYEAFGISLRHLVSSVLKAESISIHSITYRSKDPDHLREKLLRPGKSYRELTDVTDLLGLRIITYFENDVDRIEATLRKEFHVSELHSMDKRQVEDVTSFGYASVHLVCQLSADRSRLAEYKPFDGLLCEIQVRSILQHAWAEIEHDLGYKAERGVPRPIRRRFSMLAGLFALADQEFVRLRDDLTGYAHRVEEELITSPGNLLIDAVSFDAFTKTNPLCLALDMVALDVAKTRIKEPDADWVDRVLRDFDYLGIHSIDDLQKSLVQKKAYVEQLIRTTFSSGHGSPLSRGISLYYLVLVLLGSLPTKEETVEGLRVLGLSPGKAASAWADRLRTVARGQQL